MFGKLFSLQEENQENLTKEKWTREEMKAALNIKWENRTCECCGGQKWELSEFVMEHGFYNPLYRNKYYTSILVICDHCGNMKNFRCQNLFS